MAVDEKWYFTKEQLLQSPSRKSGYDVDKELSCRQQAANFIQDMGQRLQVEVQGMFAFRNRLNEVYPDITYLVIEVPVPAVSQLCINTAIVYMHRFYVFHSLAAFHRNAIAAAALFLAAKVEEQPRKLEHVIRVAHLCLHRENYNLDTKSELYLEQAQDLVFNENVLLQTLGFDVAIDHPHTHVVRCCQLVRASKDLAQTSYFMASNSLHLTTMCLQYKPTVVACFCIHLACKWSNWEIPRSNEGKDWFWYIDKTVTVDLLEQLTAEFLAILDKCPTKLKRKMMSMNQNNSPGFTQQSIPNDSLHFEEPRKLTGSEANKPPEGLFPLQKSNSQSFNESKPGTSTSSTAQPHTHHQKIDYREYREKKERERIEREKQQQQHQRDGLNISASNHHHHHHSKSGVIPGKNHSNVQSRNSSSSTSHKSYQQPPHGIQQNAHFQSMKDNRDSNSQSFQSSSSTKESSYLKQHQHHGERDGSKENTSFHGQYSQNSANVQPQVYPHKTESNYSGSYSHREGNRNSHGVQNSGNSNLPQTHHSQNQNSISSNSNLISNSRETLIASQRESAIVKDSDSQPQSKDAMSSSIRDIIGQSVSQKDVHSMTNERKEHIREKSRANYMHGNSSASNFRLESIKSGREQMGLNFHDSSERKLEEFSKLKDKSIKKEEEAVIETGKLETLKSDKFDETDLGDESGSWSFGMNLPSARNDKSNLTSHVNNEHSAGKNEFGVEPNPDSFTLSKSQSVHSAKMIDPKYKSHHFHSNSKSSDVPQIKVDKPGAQCPSDFNKKSSDRPHERHRKPQELERVPNTMEGSCNLNDVSKHHKLNKEGGEKHKMLLSGQHSDQRMKEKLSPSKYQKLKAVQRPNNLSYMKSEPSHFSLDAKSNNSNEGDKVEGTNQSLSLKSLGADETNKNIGNLSSFQKQKSHEFGAPGNLSSSLSDSNFAKSNKTSSIFSPDSKIPPQNILNSLEKDSKKNISSTHRSQPSNKTPESAKKSVPTCILGTITTSTTSTTGSLFSPPLPKNVPSVQPRHRTSSSGSEPELIPVLTKLEETPGYENIMREKIIALTPTNSTSPNSEKEKKQSNLCEKTDANNAFLFNFDQKTNTKENRSNDILSNEVKSDVMIQSITSKPVVNVKFSNEIRSDLGAVIYPTNPKSTPISKSNQGFSLSESKLSLANSVSTVNLLGIEKMVDTSISPSKPSSQFGSSTVKTSVPIPTYNSTATSVNAFGSSVLTSTIDPNGKMSDQKSHVLVTSQDSAEVDILGYSEKKRSEKKKKKEKHKHKEKDKDKSERKKEKKKHKEKDRERSKEKEKYKDKEKHKDKHKEKEIDVVSSETPIKITIPKDKISGSLKIKISKDCLKKEEIEPPKPNTSGELKIKISKDVFSNISTYKEESKSESKKRERSPKSSSDLPHSKAMKTSDKKSSASSLKSNGMEGSSRNSNSHKYPVSENDSCFDISSFYDCPFDFEENGQGIIKTPDYDFEALNASEFPQESNTSPDIKEIEDCDKNSHNESELTKGNDCVATGEQVTNFSPSKEPESCYINDSCGDVTINAIPKAISPLKNISTSERFIDEDFVLLKKTSSKHSPLNESYFDIKRDENLEKVKYDDPKKDQTISLENCDVLKNYKTILDSHSRRESEILKHSVSPVSPEDITTESNKNSDDNNNKNRTDEVVTNCDKSTLKEKNSSDTENPNYYNKYFKKENGSRIRPRDDKWSSKDKNRFEDRQRYYESRRYRTDYNERNERDRRDERRYYRDYREYGNDSSQYYFERKDERRFEYTDYSVNQYFSASKTESNLASLNFEINANGTPTVYQNVTQTKTTSQFPQICEPAVPGNSTEMNVSYQYGYFSNYMYPTNGGYRFYGNVPFVNVSLIHQQPIPPGTGDSVIHLEPPPLPLEPPPDLPPPPETPPPPPPPSK